MKLSGPLLGAFGLGVGVAVLACSTSSHGAAAAAGVAGGCSADPTLACAAGSTGVACPPGGHPQTALPGYVCSDPATQADGSGKYCCVPNSTSGTTCAEDDTVPGCAYPSIGVSCSLGDSPEQPDSSLQCSAGVADPAAGTTQYCCQ